MTYIAMPYIGRRVLTGTNGEGTEKQTDVQCARLHLDDAVVCGIAVCDASICVVHEDSVCRWADAEDLGPAVAQCVCACVRARDGPE